MSTVKKTILFFLAAFFAFASLPAAAQVSVWTYHYDNHRTGLNTNETILNLTNVNSSTFGKLISYAVDGCVYAQPLYVPNLNIQGQAHNVVFIATEHDSVYAFDTDNAGASGGLLWKTNLGVSAVTVIPGVFTNKNFGTRYNNGAYTDIFPEVGITGTPVIDTNTGTLYVDAFTGEISGGVTNYVHRMHALNITNGAERSFSPVVITATVSGTGVDNVGSNVTFNAKQENQRPALSLAAGIVYVAYAGYAEANRAPTPAELSCASPADSCSRPVGRVHPRGRTPRGFPERGPGPDGERDQGHDRRDRARGPSARPGAGAEVHHDSCRPRGLDPGHRQR